MKYHYLRLAFLCLCLFAGINALAYDAKINGIYYNFSGDNAEVTYGSSNYASYSGNVVIPESVTYNGKPYSVTSIGDYAFSGCSGLTSVTIPGSVTSIGDDAFYGCSGLTSVTIPGSVTSIGYYAFENCSGLTSVTIPESVTSIGNYAFSDCSGLTSVTIPGSVTSIGDNAFSGCSGLTSVTIQESVTSIGAWAFSGCSGLTSVTIPESVTSIGNSAFEGCSGLTSVTIPESVTSIGYNAFYGCSSLTSVTIPGSVTSIGNFAFSGCSGLTSVKIEDSNTIYDSRGNCNAIIETATNTLIAGCKNTTIPGSVTNIGDYAFRDCSDLTSVTIPESVSSIGIWAFYGCSGLTSVTIPESMLSIGAWAFYNCSGLNDVYCYAENVPTTITNAFDDSPIASATLHVPAGALEQYKATLPWSGFGTIVAIEDDSPSIIFADANVKTLCVANWDTNGDGELSEAEAAAVTDIEKTFRGNKLIGSFEELKYFTGLTSIEDNAFRGCTGLTSIIIPEKVTSIGSDAFSGCTSLSSISIPASVTSIGDYALSNCSVLTEFWCYAEALPSADEDIFDGTNTGTATLYVPKVSLTQYKTTAPWSGFGSIVPIEGYTTYNINDEMASLSIASEESGGIVNFTHDFNGEWEALCLPFAIDYDEIKADFDLAEIDGVVQNDDNNDGIIDFTVLSIRGFKEQTTEPNTPYLIRAKNAGEQTISFEDITVYPTAITSVDCSSTSTKYEFTGSYNALNASALADRYIINNGELVKGGSHLAPCRWYMTATARKGSLNLPAKIRIMPVEDVITGSPLLTSPEEDGKVYNLDGLRLSKMQKGINIKDGKKVMIK